MGWGRAANERTGTTPSRQDQNQKVYAQLERLNMSQNRLADLSGLTSGYLSMLLTGKRSASPDARRRIQQVLGADFNVIFEMEVNNDS